MTENLINPFIIYWDINPAATDEDIMRIRDELVEAEIFILDVRDLSVPLSNATIHILDKLSPERIKIRLTAHCSILQQPLEPLKGVRLRIECNSLEDLQTSLDDILNRNRQGHEIGVSFDLNKKNFGELPAFFSLCTKNNIRKITIPIQRVDGREIFYPDPEQALMLSEEMDKPEMGSQDLSIHDPFLWKLFYKRDNPNEDGCNGAKTMVCISENLDITPCPIMPVSMGNLHEKPLKDILVSKTRRQIRENLFSPPMECASCDEVSICKGGCRGRTYVRFGNFDRKDPACPNG